jgi:3-phenylpropionate/trans-cinnamate dioxygenase ferredoxin reductase subunit
VSSGHVVIVGAGQAGAELAFTLRSEGHTGDITIVGSEVHPPYQRPPLSKALLSSGVDHSALHVRAPEAYERAGISMRLGRVVTGLDRMRHTIEMDDGTRISYDRLALTTGGRPRTLSWGDGTILPRTLYTLEDAVDLMASFAPGRRLLVVGGGFIGLEAAAAAAAAGLEVTVVHAGERVMSRVVSPAVSDFFARMHESRGVTLRLATTVEAVHRADRSLVARLSDGSAVTVDDVIVGIGQIPADALAEDAGLEVDEGILVDERARTSDPDIFAAGDCTRQEHGFLGMRTRVESQQNATEQARIAARSIVGSTHVPAGVPWFWSEQFGTRLQIAGVAHATDEEIVRGDPEGDSFSALLVRGGRVVAIQAVNRPRDYLLVRRMLASGAYVRDRALLSDDTAPWELALAPDDDRVTSEPRTAESANLGAK